MKISQDNYYRRMEPGQVRRSHGGGGTHFMMQAGPDAQLPQTFAHSNGKTYRRVNYGTIGSGGGTMYVENPSVNLGPAPKNRSDFYL